MKLDLKPASDYPVPDLVKYLNLSFENYLVPIQLNLTQFLGMLRKDSIDLAASRVLMVNNRPSGLALIARRGWTCRLAAMGIAKEIRGRGLSAPFMSGLIGEARERGEREMVLEVFEQNEPAVRLYQRCRFQIVRRLIGMIRTVADENGGSDLDEIDLREAGSMITQHGSPDLPWQLSGETIAHMNPPARAYRKGRAYAVISNPDVEHVTIYSLLVEPEARGHGLGAEMLRSVFARHTGRIWHIPAILPEELSKVFEEAGFEREDLSQWQMRLDLRGPFARP